MKKKFLFVLFVLMLVLIVSACQKVTDDDKPKENPDDYVTFILGINNSFERNDLKDVIEYIEEVDNLNKGSLSLPETIKVRKDDPILPKLPDWTGIDGFVCWYVYFPTDPSISQEDFCKPYYTLFDKNKQLSVQNIIDEKTTYNYILELVNANIEIGDINLKWVFENEYKEHPIKIAAFIDL